MHFQRTLAARFHSHSCRFSWLLPLPGHMFHVHSIKDEKHEIHQCPHCQYRSLDKCILDKHMQKHLIGRNFPCRYCSKYFQTADVRQSHETVVHKPKKHSCQFCSFCTAKAYLLKLHVQSVHTHPDYKPFQCVYCSLCTTTSQRMWKHITRSHQGMSLSYIKLGPAMMPTTQGEKEGVPAVVAKSNQPTEKNENENETDEIE